MKDQTRKRKETMDIHKKIQKTLKDYAEVSTGHGIRYIFEDKGNGLTRFIWATMVIGFIVISSIISKDAYDDWGNNPILTSVATTGLPIEKIQFPAITLCNQGNVKEVTQNVIKFRLDKYIQNTRNISLVDIQAKGLEYLKQYLMEFFNTENINIIQALKIIKSINPDATLRASIAQNKIDPCNMNKTIDLFEDSDKDDDDADYDDNVDGSRYECPYGFECFKEKNTCIFVSSKVCIQSKVKYFCSSLDGAPFEILTIKDIEVIMDIKNNFRVPIEFRVELKINEIEFKEIINNLNGISSDIKDYSNPCIAVHIAENTSIQFMNTNCSNKLKFACILRSYSCKSSAIVGSPDCPKGFWKDGNTCIFISPTKYPKERYSDACKQMNGSTFQMKKKEYLSVILSILRFKKNLLPKTFHIDVDPLKTNMNYLSRLLEGSENILINTTNEGQCLMISMAEKSVIYKSECDREANIICVKNLPMCPYRKSAEKPTNQLLLPEKAYYIGQYSGLVRKWIDTFFSDLNQDKAYNELFHLLWFDKMPCFDVSKPIQKNEGLCCVFNLEKAENMFRESKYSKKLSELQREEKNLAKEFSNWDLEGLDILVLISNPEYHPITIFKKENHFPKMENMKDVLGFHAYVGGVQQYPLLSRHSISLRTGEQNYIKISAIDVETDIDLEYISSEKRNCYFSHEKKDSMDFKDVGCDCKPDCKETIYTTSFSSLPFRSCNFLNLEMSYFCNFQSEDLPVPQIFVEVILN
ncbi:ASICN [Lepeophtheirus salmonis]|uniref:ASICN n=1 Tax=Lepeophtheirus salmonis TaxID=72036 RepID=A0A7R8CN44_LEPSM|nr:ASICN [Lepeophtheirus salmonis]CAF2842826.1 ASICN [Lepeophtheirus salmonis]